VDLPFLLAGPIVRRARTDQVLIWVAVSKDVHLGAEAYRTKKQGSGHEIDTSVPIGEGTSGKRIWLGNGLWVHLIELLPNSASKGAFPTREIIAYDILGRNHPLRPIRTKPTGTRAPTYPPAASPTRRSLLLASKPAVMSSRLASTGERLKDWPGVKIEWFCLEGFDKPTFVLQDSGRRDLTAFYGSCRKLHGAGDDGAMLLAERLRFVAGDKSSRPTALFLTGDQIYADDVHDDLIGHITDLGQLLTRGVEPLPDVRSPLGKPKQRGKVAQDLARFTSSEADNHVFTFGEFAALYLLAWNPEVWPDPSKMDVSLKMAAIGSGAMRRVLANVPTYMIFDDHEITDDWNLNEPWRKDVANSVLGTRVIANGLAAFFVFQAWGNQPEVFDDAWLDLLERRMEDPGVDEQVDKDWDRTLHGFRGWHFVTPTTPPALFLDTRTSRGPSRSTFDHSFRIARVGVGPLTLPITVEKSHDRRNEPPLLIDAAGMRRAAGLVGDVTGQSLVVVAASPVLQVEAVEALAAVGNWWNGPYDKDFESWHANHESFIRLFTDLIGSLAPESCVILSGDVHFAQVSTARIETHKATIRVLQMTSSALKNEVGVAPFFWYGRSSRERVDRRIWWLRPSGLVVWQDANAEDTADQDLERDLIDQFGPSDVVETTEFQNLGITGQGIMLEHSNMGVLQARSSMYSYLYASAKGSQFMTTQFRFT
jgi:hypothetical protein